MLIKKSTPIIKSTIYLDRIKENIDLSCYHIKASDLKKMLGIPISQIDDILETIIDVPIKKYRKTGTTYYIFPIELLISNYMLTKASSVKVKDFTHTSKSY